MPTAGLQFLLEPPTELVAPIVVLSGDEAFLKRECLHAVRRLVVGDGQGEFAWNAFTGREADWRDVSDSLSAISLFGGGRQAAVVEDADTFVTAFRSQLEDYVARPPKGSTLVLEVKTWNGATRLAKAADKAGVVLKCQPPDRGAELGAFRRQAKQWLIQQAADRHQAKLAPAAADLLMELLPLSLGVLQQEVARLSLLAEPGRGGIAGISPELVQKHVGGWRTQKTWDMIDAMADGNAADALGQLDRLLLAGEQPIGLLAQVASTLRRFSAAAMLYAQAEAGGRRGSLRNALEQAGVVKFKLADAERQLKQIGRGRAAKLDRRLLDADLAMKGHNSKPDRARLELERLIAWLSQSADPRRAKS